MTKKPRLNTKYIVLVIILFLSFSILSLVLGAKVFAQEDPNEVAEKYGISFPISDLGGCKDYYGCRNYCEDPSHYDACISFAKSKGFYKEEEHRPSTSILARARTVLGCNSLESCKSFCQEPENFDKCDSFAQSVGVVGGYKEDPTSRNFLAKARELLGCDSYDSCRNFCDNPANRDKCAEFAREIGVNGGYEYKGPGGCTSEETCRAFCTNPTNIEICKQFSSAHDGSFSGPGGCSDESSCRAYCEKDPSSCHGFGGAVSSPSEYCSKTPGCSWTGTSCQCTSTTTYGEDPASMCQKYNCSWTGSYCQCSSTGDYQEKWQSECTKYPSCSWTGNSCQCSSSGQYSPPSYTSPYPTSGNYDPATECAKHVGCSWTGTTCQCSGSGDSTPYPTSSTYDPATECAKYPGCSWTGSTCQCSSGGETQMSPSPTPVYGVSTSSGGLLQYIIQLLGQ